MIYQLDYNPDGVRNQSEYVQMFEDCGWEYLKEFMGYTYFRKPADQMVKEENIFCDDQSRLELMSRIFQGRMIPLIGIFAILLYNLYRNISDPAWTIIFGVLTGLYIVVFLQFAIKYISYRNRILKQ